MVKYLSSFLLLFSITLNSQTELKFNLASAPFLVPNIGIEVKISERFGYQLDVSGAKLFSEASWVDGAELSGGIGVFQGRVPQVWYLSPFGSANGMSTVFVGHWMLGDYVTGENGFDWRDYYDGTQLHTLLDLSSMRGGAANAFAPGLTVLAGPSKHFKTSFALIMASAYLKQYEDAVLLFYDSEFGSPQDYFKSFV